MKATNKFWENFVVECGASVPKKFQTKPKNHDKYKWISQDGAVFKVEEIKDMHLANIYVMLTKSLACHEELEDYVDLFVEPNGEMAQDMYMAEVANLYDQVRTLRKHLSHIAYEVFKRKLFVNNFNISENVAKRS